MTSCIVAYRLALRSVFKMLIALVPFTDLDKFSLGKGSMPHFVSYYFVCQAIYSQFILYHEFVFKLDSIPLKPSSFHIFQDRYVG